MFHREEFPLNLFPNTLYLEALLESMPYIRKFRQKVVVIKCGGRVLSDPQTLDMIAHDLAFLRLVGIVPVVVHGGGIRVSQCMEERGIAVRFEEGLRYTSLDVLQIAEEVFRSLNRDFCLSIEKYDVQTAPYDFRSSILKGCRLLKNGKDVGWVGHVTALSEKWFQKCFEKEQIPVIYPLVLDEKSDQFYNVNADMVASFIACSLGAQKLIFLSDIEGVYKSQERKEFYNRLSLKEAQKLIDDKIIVGGMIPKVESCMEVIRLGVDKVHIVNAWLPHSLLLEIFTNEGIGTEIVL